MRRSYRPSPGTVLGAVALIVALGGAAGATIPSADKSITGCFNKRSGSLRIIDADAGQACTSAESKLLIAAFGDGGTQAPCATGSTLYLGMCFETGMRAAAAHSTATTTCAGIAARLPSEGEMRSYVRQAGVTVGDFEWTDELADINVDSTFRYSAVGSWGSATGKADDSLPFRCVSGPLG